MNLHDTVCPTLHPHATGDEACWSEVTNFILERSTADDFLPRFAGKWLHVKSRPLPGPQALAAQSLRRGLDDIGKLCETYARALPDGCGYRVSEAQFRREIEVLALAHPRLSAKEA
ncbi:MAG: hypothetical protein M3O01_01990 [Pseudomonadota bacterium]|nr:hypothetical protein [Pseudomonadota bacterium]